MHRLAMWSPTGSEWWLCFKVGQGPDWRTHTYTHTHTHRHMQSYSLSYLFSVDFFKNSRLIPQFWEFVSCRSWVFLMPFSLYLLLFHFFLSLSFVPKLEKHHSSCLTFDGCGERDDDWFPTLYKEKRSFGCKFVNHWWLCNVRYSDMFDWTMMHSRNCRERCWYWKLSGCHCNTDTLIMWVKRAYAQPGSVFKAIQLQILFCLPVQYSPNTWAPSWSFLRSTQKYIYNKRNTARIRLHQNF